MDAFNIKVHRDGAQHLLNSMQVSAYAFTVFILDDNSMEHCENSSSRRQQEVGKSQLNHRIQISRSEFFFNDCESFFF